VENAMTSLAQV